MADSLRRREAIRTRSSDTERVSASAKQLTTSNNEQKIDDSRRDVNAVSKIVSRKLDLFLNDVKRELAFDPTGGRRVQSAGHCVYTAIDWSSGQQSKYPSSSGQRERARSAITVTPREGSKTPRKHSATSQAMRLNQYANCLLDSEAGRNLTAIRRLRSTYDPVESVPPLLIQNFRLHFGTALTVDKYLEFYEHRGLSGGSARRNRKTNDLTNSGVNKTKGGNKELSDKRFSSSEQRLLENYYRKINLDSEISPRHLESSWDISASVRHQMRTFTVNEIRRLRQRSADFSGGSSNQIRVYIEDDELANEHGSHGSRDDGENDLDVDLSSDSRDDENGGMSLKHRYLNERTNRRLRRETSSSLTNGDTNTVTCDVSGIDPDYDSDSVDYGY